MRHKYISWEDLEKMKEMKEKLHKIMLISPNIITHHNIILDSYRVYHRKQTEGTAVKIGYSTEGIDIVCASGNMKETSDMISVIVRDALKLYDEVLDVE